MESNLRMTGGTMPCVCFLFPFSLPASHPSLNAEPPKICSCLNFMDPRGGCIFFDGSLSLAQK